MGVDAGDYDGDGYFDIFTTNFVDDYSTLYHNEGGKAIQRREQSGRAGGAGMELSEVGHRLCGLR